MKTTVIEKHNNVINKIEELITDESKSLKEIADIVAADNMLSVRDLSAVFNYILDMTCKNYITGRRLNAAYSCLVQGEGKENMMRAVDISGYKDQQSFIKAFKRKYGISPGKAAKLCDRSKIEAPAIWENITRKESSMPGLSLENKSKAKLEVREDNVRHSLQEKYIENETEMRSKSQPNAKGDVSLKDQEENDLKPMLDIKADIEEKEKKICPTCFGIPVDLLDKLTKVLELEEFYGLPRLLSEYAYNLAENSEHSLEDCFRYADSLHEYGGDFVMDPEDVGEEYDSTPEEELHKVADDETIQEIFFERNISVSVITDLLYDFGATKEEIMLCDKDMLDKFPGFENFINFSFKYYQTAYEYFTAMYNGQCRDKERVFEYYINELEENSSIEIAFEKAMSDAMFDDALEDIISGKGNPMICDEDDDFGGPPTIYDRMQEEQDQWYGKRVDDDLYYDPENVWFDKYDSYNDSW